MAGIMDILREFNTPLPAGREQAFQQWRGALPPQLRGSEDYDLQGAYLDGLQPGTNAHLGDQFKKPNHMTFSSESRYSTPEQPGGQWVDDGRGGYVFFASPTNIQQHSPSALSDYFRDHEKGNTPVLPIDWRLR